MYQDKKSEQNTFDRLAIENGYGSASEHEYEQIYAKLLGGKKEKSGRLLDVGSGPAIHGKQLKKHGYEVFCIDISFEAMKKAKVAGANHCVVGDIENMPFREESFDVCFCGCVLHHFTDLQSVSKELNRVTKENHQVVSFDPNAHHPIEYFHRSKLVKRIVGTRVTDNERSLTVEFLRGCFTVAGFKDFQFSSSQAYTRRKSFYHKCIKPLLLWMIKKIFPGIGKENMLLMKTRK